MAGPLSNNAVLEHMADAIPAHEPGEATSVISSSYEVLGLFAHACMSSLKFRLLGFDEERRIESEIQSLAPRLPSTWNAGFGSLSFVYAHKQTSMTDLINVSRMGAKIEIRGLAVGHDVIHRFELTPREYVDNTKLPLRMSSLHDEGVEDRSDLKEKLENIFTSQEKISELVELFKTHIIQKLVPKLQAEGYEESPDDRDARENAEEERRGQAGRAPGRPMPPQPPEPVDPYPLADPLAQPRPPHRPVPAGDFPPPGFEDEYEINRPPRGNPLAVPGRSPYNIGHDDLNPPGLGPHDPLRPSFIGGGLPRPGGGAGMHPTFDDPLFGGQGGQGEGYDPRAPPGARWDPIGPGMPRPGGGRGGGPFGGGGFGGGFGGDII